MYKSPTFLMNCREFRIEAREGRIGTKRGDLLHRSNIVSAGCTAIDLSLSALNHLGNSVDVKEKKDAPCFLMVLTCERCHVELRTEGVGRKTAVGLVFRTGQNCLDTWIYRRELINLLGINSISPRTDDFRPIWRPCHNYRALTSLTCKEGMPGLPCRKALLADCRS